VVLDLKAAVGSLKLVSSKSFLPGAGGGFDFCTAADSGGDVEDDREKMAI
jgi:hypothetical protein